MDIATSNLGFPRIGTNRELKKALEGFWDQKISAQDLLAIGKNIRKYNWQIQKENGIDFIPSNDFSFYDQVLDMAVTLGVIHDRYHFLINPLEQYFAMARGLQNIARNIDLPALEMTKWFDTNYHYIVPELEEFQKFKLNTDKIISEYQEAKSLGIETRPVIIGPFSFLLLSKLTEASLNKSTLSLMDNILPIYTELLEKLKAAGVQWIQIDEPSFCLENDDFSKGIFERAYSKIQKLNQRPKIMLTTYFDSVEDHLNSLFSLKLDGLHIDAVRASHQLDLILNLIPNQTLLSIGIIDGRNIWKTNLEYAYAIINKAVSTLGRERVLIAPSCSLLHCPIDLTNETKITQELKEWLAFSKQKLEEIKLLKEVFNSNNLTLLNENKESIARRKKSLIIHNDHVKKRVSNIDASSFKRSDEYKARATLQKSKLNLPDFPTTTIGSFPQTPQVRKARADWRSGNLNEKEYKKFLKAETEYCIRRQEEIGLDVLVHGEFERNDMVEYFGEKLAGFAFTTNGWVQSYGSRYVKPPIIYGDVYRASPMTVEWSTYAQSLTKKPMKGMLTGPVTILQWSFVRDDQPRSQTCYQIALALRDEIKDLENAGIKVIQVDEPAIREGLPLHKKDWPEYLNWAVNSFRLSTCGVKSDTQIHTHMCYSDFGDILDAIVALDADVLSIETSRSQMELFEDFKKVNYPNEIGPGVYDIHSPRIPNTTEIVELLKQATNVIAKERIWVNPDCGLKTRTWSEVEPALKNMVEAVKILRAH